MNGMDKRLLEIGVFQHQHIVAQAVELPFRADNALPIREGIRNALNKRYEHNIGKQCKCRQQKQEVLAVRSYAPENPASEKLIVS